MWLLIFSVLVSLKQNKAGRVILEEKALWPYSKVLGTAVPKTGVLRPQGPSIVQGGQCAESP